MAEAFAYRDWRQVLHRQEHTATRPQMTVQRALKFGPRLAATLRLDIFNVFNTVNFGIPNKDIATASTFGTITGLASDPRTMQIAARFTF